MRRFESSNQCLAPLAIVHAAAECFCRLLENHGDGMDNLSRHGLKERAGHVGFNVEDTGMGAAAGGVGSSKVSPTRLERRLKYTSASACAH